MLVQVKPEELRERALAIVREQRIPMLGSMDGDQPRLRPVAPVRTEGFTVYIASVLRTGKVGELAGNAKVELCYAAADGVQVRVAGVAERVRDRALLESIWDGNLALRAYAGSVDNPELILYEVIPHRVRLVTDGGECAAVEL